MTWRVDLHFGGTCLSFVETGATEIAAINSATRYAAALGWRGQPDRITSRRIE